MFARDVAGSTVYGDNFQRYWFLFEGEIMKAYGKDWRPVSYRAAIEREQVVDEVETDDDPE